MKNILGYVIPREYKVMYPGSLNDYVPEKGKHFTEIQLVTCKKKKNNNKKVV